MSEIKIKPGNATLLSGGVKMADQEIGAPGNTTPGWHSRGYLPHFDGYAVTQHVTFHLADSMPRDVLQRLRDELESLPAAERDVEHRKRIEAWSDAGHGSCALRVPDIGRMVRESLLFHDGKRYHLIAWVIMPNHVHVLFQPMGEWTIAKIIASWKKYTASRICAFRKSSPTLGADLKPVWHREYWDRFIRDDRHFQQTVEYIHLNPVKAGLVASAEKWEWSSAASMNKGANREIGGPGKSPGGGA